MYIDVHTGACICMELWCISNMHSMPACRCAQCEVTASTSWLHTATCLTNLVGHLHQRLPGSDKTPDHKHARIVTPPCTRAPNMASNTGPAVPLFEAWWRSWHHSPMCAQPPHQLHVWGTKGLATPTNTWTSEHGCLVALASCHPCRHPDLRTAARPGSLPHFTLQVAQAALGRPHHALIVHAPLPLPSQLGLQGRDLDLQCGLRLRHLRKLLPQCRHLGHQCLGPLLRGGTADDLLPGACTTPTLVSARLPWAHGGTGVGHRALDAGTPDTGTALGWSAAVSWPLAHQSS